MCNKDKELIVTNFFPGSRQRPGSPGSGGAGQGRAPGRPHCGRLPRSLWSAGRRLARGTGGQRPEETEALYLRGEGFEAAGGSGPVCGERGPAPPRLREHTGWAKGAGLAPVPGCAPGNASLGRAEIGKYQGTDRAAKRRGCRTLPTREKLPEGPRRPGTLTCPLRARLPRPPLVADPNPAGQRDFNHNEKSHQGPPSPPSVRPLPAPRRPGAPSTVLELRERRGAPASPSARAVPDQTR